LSKVSVKKRRISRDTVFSVLSGCDKIEGEIGNPAAFGVNIVNAIEGTFVLRAEITRLLHLKGLLFEDKRLDLTQR
jgi:hypothetical protein